MENKTTVIDAVDLNEEQPKLSIDEITQINQQHALGIMDHFTERLVKSAELLKSKIEHISIIYGEDTFDGDRFKGVPDSKIKHIKKSIESFPLDRVQEFVTKIEKVYDGVDALHGLLTKKK